MPQRKQRKKPNKKNKKHNNKQRKQKNKLNNNNHKIKKKKRNKSGSFHDCFDLKCKLFHFHEETRNDNENDIKNNDHNEDQYTKIALQQNKEFKSYLKTLTMDHNAANPMSFHQKIESIRQNIESIVSQNAQITPNILDESLDIISTLTLNDYHRNTDEKHDEQNKDQMQMELNTLHCDILTKIAHIYLSNRRDEYTYFERILIALNHCNMAIFANNENKTAHFYQIICWIKLGLFKKAQSKMAEFRNALDIPISMFPMNFEEIFETETKSSIAKSVSFAACKYQNILLSANTKSPRVDPKIFLHFVCAKDQSIAWNGMCLAISVLIQNNKWTLSDVASFFHDFCVFLYVSENPINQYDQIEFIETMFQNGSRVICTLSTILNWSAKDIAMCLDMFSKCGAFEFDDLSELFTERFGVFLDILTDDDEFRNDQFIKDLIDEVVKLYAPIGAPQLSFDDAFNTKLTKKAYLHKRWNRVYEQIQNKSELELQNVFPKSGRTEDENEDFVLIHATATALSEHNVLKEIEGMNTCIDLDLYQRNISFLHYFALNGCIETVRFLVKHGVDVNCTMDDTHHNIALSALDLCLYGLDVLGKNNRNEVNQFGLFELNDNVDNDGRRMRVKKGIHILKEFGAKKTVNICGEMEYNEDPETQNRFLRKQLSDLTGINAGLLLESMSDCYHNKSAHLDPCIEHTFGDFNPFRELSKLSKSQFDDIITGAY